MADPSNGYATGLINAERAGRAAHAAGKDRKDNPYRRWDFWKSWLDGFENAAIKKRREDSSHA